MNLLEQLDALKVVIGTATVVTGSGVAAWRATAKTRERLALRLQHLDALPKLASDVHTIREAWTVNGGHSLADLAIKTWARVGLLSDYLPIPLWEADWAGRNTKINQEFSRVFGWSNEEMLRHGWKSCLLSGDATGAREYVAAWEEAVRENRAFVASAMFRRSDGGMVPVRVLARQCDVPAGTPADSYLRYWMGTVTVIDEGSPHE